MITSLPFFPVYFQRVIILTSFVIVVTALSGCSSISGFFEPSAPEDMNLKLPAETLVEKGMEEFNRGKYFMAIEYFSKVLENHRFTPQALLAELKMADCSYYMEKYIEAYMYYEKFEEMHPTNEAIPYVMYQKAMCHYKQIDKVDRDSAGAVKAIEYFQHLIKVYPNSPYVEDAKAKIDASIEFLANHEYGVVKFYLRTDKDNQAIIRLKYLLAMYPESKIAPKAKKLLEQLDSD